MIGRMMVMMAWAAGMAAGAEAKKDRPIVVGFCNIGYESAWRMVQVESIEAEAKKRGIDLRMGDARGEVENQVRVLRRFTAQRVDVIALAPVVESTEWGLGPTLKEIRDAGIPVVLLDRAVDDPAMFRTVVLNDYVEEGRQAGRWLAKQTGGKAMIAELQGTPGSAPAIDRKKGFEEVLAKHPGMKIIKSYTGDFTRAKGKEVMESLLKSPEGKQITALYAHNDDMALGAIRAIEEAGLQPGQQITIVSIDGIRPALEAIVAGKLNCTVECTPNAGPVLFDTIEAIVAGKKTPKSVALPDRIIDRETAQEALKGRKW